MIRTWHDSCTHACTCTTSPFHQFQFAPPASSPGACAKGGRRWPVTASAATLNNPERPYSLPAGRRSLMGGCATRRQTRAQGGVVALHISRAIRPTRRFIQHQTDSHSRAGQARWGRCDYRPAVGGTGRRSMGGLGCLLPVLTGRGFGPGTFFRFGAQPRRQAIAEQPPVIHFPMPFRTHRLDSHDANENGLPNAETSFAPGAKAHD